MSNVLKNMYDENKPSELQDKVTVSLLYCGLLRRAEVLQVEIKDVDYVLTESIEVNFPHPTKRSARGFSFTIPAWLKPTFIKYSSQIAEEQKPESRFLKNFSGGRGGKGRIQNMGTKMVGKLAKNVAVWVHGEEKAKKLRLTTHSFRRSAATSLAEYGISIVALCHAGRWASVVTAQEYQEHSS